jgi:hypothetical protein
LDVNEAVRAACYAESLNNVREPDHNKAVKSLVFTCLLNETPSTFSVHKKHQLI